MLDEAPPTTPKPQGTPPKNPLTARVWIFGAIALAFVYASLKPKTVPTPAYTAPTPSYTVPAELSSDIKNKMALVINMSGQLCATVTDITRISGDLYRTTCIRYRDGTGTTTYQVDAATGAIK